MNSNQFNDCIQKICNNDLSGLEIIYKEYYSKMKITALAITNQLQTAEDIASDFIKYILENADKLHKINTPNAWINKSIRNNSLACINSNKKKYVAEDLSNIVFVAPDKKLELKIDFYKIFETLSTAEKEIFIQHYLYGLKYKEIYDNLDIPVNTIKWKISILKDKFKELEKYL